MRYFKELREGQCGMVSQGILEGPLGPVMLEYNCLNGYAAVLKPVAIDGFLSLYEGFFFTDDANAVFMFYQKLPDPKTLIAAKGPKPLVDEALDDVFTKTPIKEAQHFDIDEIAELAEREGYILEGQRVIEELVQQIRLGKVAFVAEEKPAPAKEEKARLKGRFDLQDALRNLRGGSYGYGAHASADELRPPEQDKKKPKEKK
jgi:hypothetical protein